MDITPPGFSDEQLDLLLVAASVVPAPWRSQFLEALYGPLCPA
jgi:hypothetical protein